MGNPTRFRLAVTARIQQCQEYPPGSGNWNPTGSNGLEFSESFDVGVVDFAEIAAIVGRIHALGLAIEAEA